MLESLYVRQQSIEDKLRNETINESENVRIAFPQFTKNGQKAEVELRNRLIKEDIKKILEVYGVEYNIDSKDGNRLQVPEAVEYLHLNYEVMQNLANLFSVLYFVDFFAQGSAYPTTSPYSTNIDLTNNTRIRLNQKVTIDESFLSEFTSWKFVQQQEGEQTLEKEAREYLAQLGDDLLLHGFQNADLIGSGNTLGIYSYYRDNTTGLAISLPHYLGGYGLFEKA